MTSPTSNSLAEYRLTHDRCAVCYSRGESWNDRLEIHHIVGRYKKELGNDHRNLLVLCCDCHAGYHSGGGCSLTLGNVLWAKREEDGESGLDLTFLASLKNRVGLSEDPEDLPVWALEARKDFK
jgi:hypothetical protein